MKKYISASEFGRIVKRDAKTVISWIEHGWIPAKRIGHRFEIPVSEVEVYKNSVQYPPKKWQK